PRCLLLGGELLQRFGIDPEEAFDVAASADADGLDWGGAQLIRRSRGRSDDSTSASGVDLGLHLQTFGKRRGPFGARKNAETAVEWREEHTDRIIWRDVEWWVEDLAFRVGEGDVASDFEAAASAETQTVDDERRGGHAEGAAGQDTEMDTGLKVRVVPGV